MRSEFIKGVLIHVSHYDPAWLPGKANEKPFDSDVAISVVEAMAAKGMNTLFLGLSDGMEYKSHPELKRHYSVSAKEIKKVCLSARANGVEIVPKLNFSKSARNMHDMWLSPYSDVLNWRRDYERYLQVSKDVIEEVVELCQPGRFFHIGMDEDHFRSLSQYVDDILHFRDILKGLGLRTAVWNDSCHDELENMQQVHAEKCIAAEKRLPRDIMHVLWNYYHVKEPALKRLKEEGFDAMVAPGTTPDVFRRWTAAVHANDGAGILLTKWVKCTEDNRAAILGMIESLGGMS